MERVRSVRRLTSEQTPLLPKHHSPPVSPPAKQPSPRRRSTGILVAALALVLVLHLSASLIAGEPPVDPPGVAWADLQLDGDASASLAAFSPPSEPLAGPTLIPRIIHQLYNASTDAAAAAEASYLRWRKANPGWELRFYDEADSQIYVGRWFPQFTAVYNSLRSEIERRDLFRYLTVLRHGGVFVDVHAPAIRPLAEVVRPEDSLVAAWDAEFASGQAAISSCYVRARQLQHRLFAAAPGHPALREAVDKIAATLETKFSLHPMIDALERTGPGVFTDAVLKHAHKHPPAMRGAPGHWNVRLLPRKAFGEVEIEHCEQPWDAAPGNDKAGVDSGLVGSSATAAPQQNRSRKLEVEPPASRTTRLARWWWWSFWRRQKDEPESEAETWRDSHRPDVAVASHLERLAAAHEEKQLFPVSAEFEPPFDVMTHLVSHGERQSGWDVSQVVSTYGAWQPSVQPTRRPSLAEAVVGSLGSLASRSSKNTSSSTSSGTSTSTNDGEGSRSSTKSQKSGFRVTYVGSTAPVMASSAVLVDVGAGYGMITLAAAARGHHVHAFELGPGSLDALEASIERNGFGSLVQIHKVPLGALNQRGPTCLELRSGAAAAAGGLAGSASFPTNVELARGYSDPAAHAMDEHSGGGGCARSALRLPGAEALPAGQMVGAMRISANGWEGFVLEGFLPLIRKQRPPVIAVEWNPVAMRAVGYRSPLDLLRVLSSLGYDDISHSGFICDERWYGLTYGVRRRGGERPEDQPGLRQPTWCRLLPEDHTLLLEKANSKYPETLLFINSKSGKSPGSVGEASGPAEDLEDELRRSGGGLEQEDLEVGSEETTAAREELAAAARRKAATEAVRELAATSEVTSGVRDHG